MYGYLIDRANKDGECWPAIPTIAEEIKLSEATVHRAIKDLKKAGIIVISQVKYPLEIIYSREKIFKQKYCES